MSPGRRPSASNGGRHLGRPRQYTDADERALVMAAGYAALREHGSALTITHILAAAGISTRSFYRHFSSKDELLCAMYRRNAEAAAEYLSRTVIAAGTPREAVVAWIAAVFDLVLNPRTAQRAAVMRSIVLNHAEGSEVEVTKGRQMLKLSLEEAIVAGAASGEFTARDPALAAELISVGVLHAASLLPTAEGDPADCVEVTELCLRALGA